MKNNKTRNPLSEKSRVARIAHRQIELQIKKGLKKYGKTLDDNIENLTTEDLIQHGMEEMADGIQYLAAAQIRNAMERDVAGVLNAFADWVDRKEIENVSHVVGVLISTYMHEKGF